VVQEKRLFEFVLQRKQGRGLDSHASKILAIEQWRSNGASDKKFMGEKLGGREKGNADTQTHAGQVRRRDRIARPRANRNVRKKMNAG